MADEPRPHWDASLISAVLADLRDVYDSGYGEEQAFRIIAAVEDWVLSAPIFDLYLSRKHAPDRAAIQRVRELADTWMSDGAAWGPYSARCILDALDGGCPTCEGPIRETVGLVCQTCGTDYGAQGDSDD